MATLTIRNLDESIRDTLRKAAAEQGISMEAKVRTILEEYACRRNIKPGDFARRIHAEFADIGGVELTLPEREPLPDPITFDE